MPLILIAFSAFVSLVFIGEGSQKHKAKEELNQCRIEVRELKNKSDYHVKQPDTVFLGK